MVFKARIRGVSWLVAGGFKDCGKSPMFTSKGQSCGYGLIPGYHLPLVTIACCEDGSYQLEDGHHRLVAYWLSGQVVLQSHQYFLVPKDRWKPRFGQIEKLLDRVLHAITNKAKQ